MSFVHSSESASGAGTETSGSGPGSSTSPGPPFESVSDESTKPSTVIATTSAVASTAATMIRIRGGAPVSLTPPLHHSSQVHDWAGESTRDALYVLYPRDHELAQLVDVLRFGTHDHVVRSQIGRASCRERVKISVVADAFRTQ